MARHFLRWLAPLLLTVCLFVPSANAQKPSHIVEQESGHNAAFPYAIAFLSTVLIMVIVCTPSRKR
jgi:hypothetical protein